MKTEEEIKARFNQIIVNFDKMEEEGLLDDPEVYYGMVREQQVLKWVLDLDGFIA